MNPDRAEAELLNLMTWLAERAAVGYVDTLPADACGHADDFGVVLWFGTRYDFASDQQRQAVRVLWDDYQKTGGMGLRNLTIGERIGSDGDRFRVDLLFRNRPALNAMIRRRAASTWGLAAPTPASW